MDVTLRENTLATLAVIFRKVTLVIALIALVYLTYLAFADDRSSQLIHNAAWSVTYLFIPATLISVSMRPILVRAFNNVRFLREITPMTGLAIATPGLLVITDMPGNAFAVALYSGSVLFVLSEAMIVISRERPRKVRRRRIVPDPIETVDAVEQGFKPIKPPVTRQGKYLH